MLGDEAWSVPGHFRGFGWGLSSGSVQENLILPHRRLKNHFFIELALCRGGGIVMLNPFVVHHSFIILH